ARVLVRLELSVTSAAHLERSLAALYVELNGHLLDRHHFADQLGQLGNRSAQLTGVDAENRFFLLRRNLVVEIDRGPPVSLQDVAGNVSDRGDGAAGDIDTVDVSLVEMPGNDGVAGTVIRVFADPAGAQDTAIANFEQPSFEMICHGVLRYALCVERR